MAGNQTYFTAFGPLGTGVFTTWGVSQDLQLSAANFSFRAEAFVGEAIGTYNMGIGQSLEANGLNAIRTVGGWGELWCKLTNKLTLRDTDYIAPSISNAANVFHFRRDGSSSRYRSSIDAKVMRFLYFRLPFHSVHLPKTETALLQRLR